MKNIWILATATFIILGCGGSSTTSQNSDNTPIDNGAQANIPYLRQNHTNYSQDGANGITPAPLKNADTLSLSWTIQADTQEDARILADHIRFMKSKLENGDTPRAWDQLFVLESFMKVNHYYTTEVEQNGNIVVVTKEAKNACAYAVISAHADAVSGDFFARGDTMQDHSNIAQSILNQPECDSLRQAMQRYLDSNTKQHGMKR